MPGSGFGVLVLLGRARANGRKRIGTSFKLAPHAVHGGLFAAFSGSFGELRYNLGQAPLKYAAPSSEYVGFSQFSEE